MRSAPSCPHTAAATQLPAVLACVAGRHQTQSVLWWLGTGGCVEACPFFSLLLLSLQPLCSPPCLGSSPAPLLLEPETATCDRRSDPIWSRCLKNSWLLGGGIGTEVIQPRRYSSIYFPSPAILLVKMFDESPSPSKHLLFACRVELSRQLKTVIGRSWHRGPSL